MVKFSILTSALAVCHVGFAEAKDSPRQRAEALLGKMTWEEKIAQMGGIRRLLKLGPSIDQENFDKIYELQHGNIGKFFSAFEEMGHANVW